MPQGSARQAAITNHFYLDLMVEQQMDPHWDPVSYNTWNAYFARYESDDPPPVNHNEAGRCLWLANWTTISVMRYIA
ncbi:hypothetical protein Q8G81_33845, partial [Klebsiella pneumoniae]